MFQKMGGSFSVEERTEYKQKHKKIEKKSSNFQIQISSQIFIYWLCHTATLILGTTTTDYNNLIKFKMKN